MRIGVIFTGGTIGSRQSAGGIAPSDSAPHHLLSLYREKYGDVFDFCTFEPYTILSENLSFTHIELLAECIQKAAKACERIIVTHGTDTLQYTGAALSYLLGLCSVPVVLVSANRPLTDKRSNGPDNFAAAVCFLRDTADARGVYISYRNHGESVKIHRASRVLRHHAFDDAICSVDGTVATVKSQKTHHVTRFLEQNDAQAPYIGTGISAASGKVLFLAAHPDMVYPDPAPYAAVLLETYHSGTLATASQALCDFAARAKQAGVPVFLTGVPDGGTAYESGALYSALSLQVLPPIPPIAAYMKLCLAVAGGRALKAALFAPLGGDL